MKVGISALKTLKNGQLLIESEKKSELEEVCKKINEVSREELESYIPKLKNPEYLCLISKKTLLWRTQHKP